MGSGKIYDLQEIIRKTSSQQMKDHIAVIQKFLERGYKIESQEDSEETGLHGELLNSTLTTSLRPSVTSLPMVQFKAKQIFGTYDFGKGVFTKWEEPRFDIKMYKKSADIKAFKDPWQGVDLPD